MKITGTFILLVQLLMQSNFEKFFVLCHSLNRAYPVKDYAICKKISNVDNADPKPKSLVQ